MLSCFGCGSGRHDAEREPLLPLYNDDTSLQARLHEKLHTYQMLRAISKGYMPSNEQVMIHLRSLLSADILNPDSPDLSDSGRALVRSTKLWLQQFIDFLHSKNSQDQIQDFIWYLSKSRLHVDMENIGARASRAKAKADTTAAYESLYAVGSLLLTNSDFRIFLSDLGTIGKEVFRDTAFMLSDVSKQAGKAVEPSTEEQEALKHANEDSQPPPSTEDLKSDFKDVASVVSKGAIDVAQEAEHSAMERIRGDEKEALVHRLKQAVSKLSKRPDYSESVNMISLLVRRSLLAYSHAAASTAEAFEDDFDRNPEAYRALKNFWLMVSSVGDKQAWAKVEESFHTVAEHGQSDPNFDEMVQHLSQLVQDMLADPDFFDNIEKRFNDLREKSQSLASRSSMSDDLNALLANIHTAFRSVLEDKDMHKLIRTTSRIADILSPSGSYTNSQLVTDSINVFVPMIIQAVQYVPIPRLEVSAPAIDLLMENLILEPGRTVNNSSFLPFKLNVSTRNDVEVRKARLRTTSSMTSLMTIKISGMSLAADDLGYWFRLRSGLLRMMDEGIAGFHLDERGLDIELDIEIGRERLEQIVSLRGVRVTIHKLNYTLSRSKFACLAWLLKPIVRPIVRKALEIKIAASIAEGLHFLNRELLYARERLRATQIANPKDLWTFVRAVAARLVPAPDPDLETRLGVTPGAGVFRGRYAPGSLVKLWEEEGRDAEQRVYEYEQGGWKNDIFDVKVVPTMG